MLQAFIERRVKRHETLNVSSQTDRQRQTDRQAEIETETEIARQSQRQTDGRAVRQADIQASRHTDRFRQRQWKSLNNFFAVGELDNPQQTSSEQ